MIVGTLFWLCTCLAGFRNAYGYKEEVGLGRVHCGNKPLEVPRDSCYHPYLPGTFMTIICQGGVPSLPILNADPNEKCKVLGKTPP